MLFDRGQMKFKENYFRRKNLISLFIGQREGISREEFEREREDESN